MAKKSVNRKSTRRAKIYLVRLDGGGSNKDYQQFFDNQNQLLGKWPDLTGHHNEYLLKSFAPIEFLHSEASRRKDNSSFRESVSVVEITKKMAATTHSPYLETIQKYFKVFTAVKPQIDP